MQDKLYGIKTNNMFTEGIMKAFSTKWKKMSLLSKLLIGMLVGAILGIVFGESILVVKPLGTIFLNLLKMIVLPMILCTLIAGISAVNDLGVVGRSGAKIMVYYTATTLLAAVVALAISAIIKPGVGFTLTEPFDGTIAELPSIVDTIVNLFPSNIFASLSAGTYAHALVFSIFAGCAILKLPEEKHQKIHDFFALGSDMIGAVLSIVLGFAPIGVGALVASCIGQYGASFFTFAAKFLATNYLSVFAMIAVYLLLVVIFTGRNPLGVLKIALPSMLTAFGTQSSAAVLPLNLEAADKLGCKKEISTFTIPLGNQVNKDGTAILLACSFFFGAQAAGIQVDIATVVQVILISLLLTMGYGTTVAGGAVVQVTIMIETFGLPIETVVVVSGALALIDGILTLGNNLGDLVGTVIVSDSEVKHDKKLTAKQEASK